MASIRADGQFQAAQLQAVLFDMDGLLVDTEPFWFEVEHAVMARLGGGKQFSVQGGVVTSMVAKACTNPPLVDDAVAVLGSEPLVSPVVELVMWTS